MNVDVDDTRDRGGGNSDALLGNEILLGSVILLGSWMANCSAAADEATGTKFWLGLGGEGQVAE